MNPIIGGIVMAFTMFLTWFVGWYIIETVTDFLDDRRREKSWREQHRINHENYLHYAKTRNEIAKHNGWEDKE